MRSKNILVANGVNLDLLGEREPEHYGRFTLAELERYVEDAAKKIATAFGVPAPSLEFFQSNVESVFIEKCSQRYDGMILNAGAWAHTSLALADRLRAVETAFIEVHISNIHAREHYRQHSYLTAIAKGSVSGLGLYSYTAALLSLLLS